MTDTSTTTGEAGTTAAHPRAFRMQRLRYEFILEAAQPIAHAKGTFGNQSICMRESIRLPGGSWADVPIITGDTLRHGLREAAAYAALDVSGLLAETGLTEEALRLLFNGGMITGRGAGDGSFSLDVYRELVELMPALKLLGGCANNRAIEGTIDVDNAMLICAETERLIQAQSPWVIAWLAEHEEELATARVHVDVATRVRMDSLLSPEKRALLSADAQVAATKRLLASEKAHDDDDAVAKEREKSSMMPREHEFVKRGSLFMWGLDARVYNELDHDTLLVMVGVFLSRAKVGGKKAHGHGRIIPRVGKAVHGQDLSIQVGQRKAAALPSGLFDVDEAAAREAAASGERRIGDLFRDHVMARKDRLRELLKRVDA